MFFIGLNIGLWYVWLERSWQFNEICPASTKNKAAIQPGEVWSPQPWQRGRFFVRVFFPKLFNKLCWVHARQIDNSYSDQCWISSIDVTFESHWLGNGLTCRVSNLSWLTWLDQTWKYSRNWNYRNQLTIFPAWLRTVLSWPHKRIWKFVGN